MKMIAIFLYKLKVKVDTLYGTEGVDVKFIYEYCVVKFIF
jgi:hypothetical protein